MDEAMPKKTGPSRIWRIVFVISLALNLAVVGMIIGAGASGKMGKSPPRSFDLGLGPIAAALAPEDRRAIGRSLRGNRDLRGINFRGQFRDLLAALRQDPFAPAALEAILADQSENMMRLQAQARLALIVQIEAMSAEEREAFANRLEQEFKRPQRDHDKRSGG